MEVEEHGVVSAIAFSIAAGDETGCSFFVDCLAGESNSGK